MKAVLVKNAEDDYDPIEVEIPDDSHYVTYKGRTYDFCGIEDGVAFFTDLHEVSRRMA